MTADPTRRSRVPPAFPSLGYLYRPADASVGTSVVEADAHWTPPTEPDPGVDVLIWGRLARNARPTAADVADGVRREMAVRRLSANPPSGFHLAELHRLPPVRRPGRWRRPIRSFTLGGALAELTRSAADEGRPTRVIDAVVSAAGSEPTGVRLRAAGDGSALARLDVHGVPAELRVAKAGHTKNPAKGHAALVALEAAGVGRVPRPMGGDITAGAAWSTESVVHGHHVQDLTPGLLDQVIQFAATLPTSAAGSDGAEGSDPGTRSAIDDQLADVADLFPEYATELADVAAAAGRWGASLEPVLVHGDLWLNNVFTDDDRLTAVFDWDTWHPAGLPGTDIVNLLAAEARTRERRDVGPLLIADYWREPEVVDALTAYFAARDRARPDAAGLAAIATGWWASRIAGALHRATRQVDDPAWTKRNIADALPRFEQLEREFG